MWKNVVNVYLQQEPLLDEVGVQASILELLSSLVSDIKVAIVAGRDVTRTVQEVRAMVDGVKAANFDERDLLGSSPPQRVRIMKNKRRLVVEVLIHILSLCSLFPMLAFPSSLPFSLLTLSYISSKKF